MCLVTSAKERNKAGRGLGETVGEGGCKFSVPPPPDTHTEGAQRHGGFRERTLVLSG